MRGLAENLPEGQDMWSGQYMVIFFFVLQFLRFVHEFTYCFMQFPILKVADRIRDEY